jgi:uncharacterized protein
MPPDLITKELKIIEFTQIKMSDPDDKDYPDGLFEGYASTFGNFDRVGEAVVKGAFLDTLEEFLKDGFIAVGHGWSSLPIATVVDAYEDDIGLYIKAAFHSTQAAQDARTVMCERLKRGKSAFLSIGYRVLDDQPTEDGRRLLKKIQLREVSFVTAPANPLAAITGAKSWLDTDYTENDLRELVEAEFKFDNSLLAGLTFLEHTTAVLAATQAWVSRANSIIELRSAKSNHQRTPISTANEQRLVAIQEGLVTVLDTVKTLLALKDVDEPPVENPEPVQEEQVPEEQPAPESVTEVAPQVEPEMTERVKGLRIEYLKLVARNLGVQV